MLKLKSNLRFRPSMVLAGALVAGLVYRLMSAPGEANQPEGVDALG